jgi:hypothetical protein
MGREKSRYLTIFLSPSLYINISGKKAMIPQIMK